MDDESILGDLDPELENPAGERVHISALTCADQAWTTAAPRHTYQFIPPYKCILCGATPTEES